MNEVATIAITLKAPSGCFFGMIEFSAVDLLPISDREFEAPKKSPERATSQCQTRAIN